MRLGCGPLPVLQTFRDKEPFSRRGGNSEGTGDCPWAGRRYWVMGSGLRSGFRSRGHNRRASVQDFSSAWLIVSGQSWVEFSLVSSS